MIEAIQEGEKSSVSARRSALASWRGVYTGGGEPSTNREEPADALFVVGDWGCLSRSRSRSPPTGTNSLTGITGDGDDLLGGTGVDEFWAEILPTPPLDLIHHAQLGKLVNNEA